VIVMHSVTLKHTAESDVVCIAISAHHTLELAIENAHMPQLLSTVLCWSDELQLMDTAQCISRLSS
jgi:hypothetical protein